jgi:uncharacterized membrane protein YgcG
VLGGSREVTRAAQAVAAHGATVRVRTYRQVADGDLDAAVEAQVRRCASWRDEAGDRRSNLVVLAVSLRDRRTGLYYGSGWQDALDTEQEAIQTDTVNPLLRRQQYAGAVRAGLLAVERLLPAAPAEAPPADDEVPAEDLAPGSDETVTTYSQPFGDMSGLSDGVGAMVPVVGFGILAVFAVFAVILVATLRNVGGGPGGGTGGGAGVRRRRGSWGTMDGVDHGYSSGSESRHFGGSAGRFSRGSGSGFSGGSSGSSGSSGSDGGSSSSSGGGSSTSW